MGTIQKIKNGNTQLRAEISNKDETGELGKNFNDKVKRRITGQELLEAAIRQTQNLQYQVGGMVAFVEAENKEKLLAFYENYGFKRFDTRQTVLGDAESHELVQLLKLI